MATTTTWIARHGSFVVLSVYDCIRMYRLMGYEVETPEGAGAYKLQYRFPDDEVSRARIKKALTAAIEAKP